MWRLQKRGRHKMKSYCFYPVNGISFMKLVNPVFLYRIIIIFQNTVQKMQLASFALVFSTTKAKQ